MDFILKKIYKINWLIKKTIGYHRKNSLLKIDDNFVPSKDKKIVYSIACHVNPRQVIKLVEAIYSEENIYYINIDLKSSVKFHRAIKKHFLNYKNVYLTNNVVDWGRWSQVQVILDIIENALKIDTNWTHFINLSGQDLPLKNQAEIVNDLSKNIDTNFIEANYFPPEHEKSERLFSLRPWGKKKKDQPRLDLLYPDIKFYKGSQWMILSRDFCDYVINGDFSKKLQALFKEAFIPDESFFPTLAANSHFANKIVWHNKRFIDWTKGGAHPEVITMNYLPKITNGDFYFARKFDERVDPEVIDELLKRL